MFFDKNKNMNCPSSLPPTLPKWNLLRRTETDGGFKMGQRRQRPASTPLAGSTQSAGHTIESGSRSAGLSWRAVEGWVGGGLGAVHIEREKGAPHSK